MWNITGIDAFEVPGCYGHVSVYEPLTNRIIGHGGYRGIFLDDTWMYNPDKRTLYVLIEINFVILFSTRLSWPSHKSAKMEKAPPSPLNKSSLPPVLIDDSLNPVRYLSKY